MVKKISGAGVIIITTYDNIPCIVLAYDIKRRKYNDFGGRFEPHKHKNILDTAKQELYEESAGLFDVKKKYFKKFKDCKLHQTYYRYYYIKIKHVNINSYQTKLKKLKKNNAPKYMLETNDITYIPIMNVKKKTKDVFGDDIKIHNRALHGIKIGKKIIDKYIS